MAPDKHHPTSPDTILRKAFEKEKNSRDFYEELALGCSVEFVRDLLEKLMNEESKHMRMIQDMISRLESGREIV